MLANCQAMGGHHERQVRFQCLRVALLCCCWAAAGATPAVAEQDKAEITVLYDAFGKTSTMKKDWGFSAFIEYGGKRILFDTGNNAEIFAHNVEAKGIDLTTLDFVVVSHRHGDHTSGLNYLLTVNPGVTIYVPKENFGVFGAALPGTFYKRDKFCRPRCATSMAIRPRPCGLAVPGHKATSRGSPRRPRSLPAFI